MITHGYKREEGVKDSSKFLNLINGGRFILLTEKRGAQKRKSMFLYLGAFWTYCIQSIQGNQGGCP